MREVTKEIYSFLITVDCNDKEIEELKGEVKANKFLTRVYMYSISLKDFEKI